MFKHLLVPLDGSRLAEAALPAAILVAQKSGAKVTLLHVIERNAPKSVHGNVHLRTAEEAETCQSQGKSERKTHHPCAIKGYCQDLAHRQCTQAAPGGAPIKQP